MTEREKMIAGMLYDPSDEELSALLVKARKLARRYNQIDEDDTEHREEVLRALLPNTPFLQGSPGLRKQKPFWNRSPKINNIEKELERP